MHHIGGVIHILDGFIGKQDRRERGAHDEVGRAIQPAEKVADFNIIVHFANAFDAPGHAGCVQSILGLGDPARQQHAPFDDRCGNTEVKAGRILRQFSIKCRLDSHVVDGVADRALLPRSRYTGDGTGGRNPDAAGEKRNESQGNETDEKAKVPDHRNTPCEHIISNQAAMRPSRGGASGAV